MDYLIRLVQVHESFRVAELEALAALAEVKIEFVSYLEDVSLFPGIVIDSASSSPQLQVVGWGNFIFFDFDQH